MDDHHATLTCSADDSALDPRSERDLLLAAEMRARLAAERAAREQRLLADASKVLASSVRVEETLPRVLDLVVPAIADAAAVAMVERGAIGRVLATRGSFDSVARVGDAAIERVASTGTGEHAGSYLIAPLGTRDQRFGALILARVAASAALDEGDAMLAEELGRRIAMAIDATRLFEQLELAQQRAEEANRGKDEFLAALSHELRTPLNAILGWARMLRAGQLDAARAARALEVIERNARVQTQLIDDLLDVSRIISGKLRLELEDLEVHGVVEMAVEAVRPQADAKGVTLHAQLDDHAGIARGDADRLEQVVWNLLTNAVKFTPEGGRVDVTLRSRAAAIEIVVEDSGQGIAPQFLPHVFDRFRQAEAGAARRHGGLGLGLAIVRHIIELHGGTIEAHSEGVDRGARFTVRIPATTRAGVRPRIAAIARPSLPPTLRRVPRLDGSRVLVVDDERDARELVVGVLRDLGAEVSAAASASEALDMAEREKPDVVVSDIAMPGRDGYSLARALPGVRAVKTIALTAYAGAEDRARAIEAGFDRHLSKPVEPADLAIVIADLLGR